MDTLAEEEVYEQRQEQLRREEEEASHSESLHSINTLTDKKTVPLGSSLPASVVCTDHIIFWQLLFTQSTRNVIPRRASLMAEILVVYHCFKHALAV